MAIRNKLNSERGQALMPFALVFVALFGMVGLVLDVGWSYYVGKKAQTAADAAAQAAVSQALFQNGPAAAPACNDLGCQPATSCPAASNLQAACDYAEANGFTAGGDNGRQAVQVAAGSGGTAPGVPNVPVDYWVQVTMTNKLPQWFSGFFLSTGFTPSAVATAALRRTNLNASLYLLNRASDCFVSALNVGLVCGEDFLSLGLNTVNAGGGIYMSSSNPSGLGLPAIAAGTVTGLATVTAPFTYLMGQGGIQDVVGANNWSSAPMNGFPDGDYFSDPFAGLPQPPAPTGLPDHPVPGGLIAGSLSPSSPTFLPPGNYYATLPILGTPIGTPIVITGNVTFSDGAVTPCGGFCKYVFYGGIVTGALATTTFAPGEYVFAGAQPVAGGPGVGLTAGANAIMKDLTPLSSGQIVPNTDAGEIFIFTSSQYPGLVLPSALSQSGLSFPQVQAGLMAGVEPQITLHGLNKSSSNLPTALAPYAPVLIWQDRANTTLKYTSNGLLDVSCNGICANILSVPGSQEMVLMASQNGGNAGTNLYGTIYGPRGSWLTILGVLPGDTVAGPLQIISGALQMTLNASLNVNPLPNPPSRLVAGLIQ
ncbi:MAG TPA: pilus assembly protein TadG-related protein [Bryobacteraceae bacterium]|jgi:Flp pilus assembly protein TadG|nr:pilus assembly protein TadG-related protein [Bryobacteraceae bacterium]